MPPKIPGHIAVCRGESGGKSRRPIDDLPPGEEEILTLPGLGQVEESRLAETVGASLPAPDSRFEDPATEPAGRAEWSVESFEQFCAVALEHEGLVVSEAVKFPVTRQTRKSTTEIQTHGYEVDLIGARADRLVLATVKSYLGSHGVHADHVMGVGGSIRQQARYKLLNDPFIRDAVVKQAAKRYGYRTREVRLRLYVGRFAGRSTGLHEDRVRSWAADQRVGGGPIEVYSLDDVIDSVREVASSTTYRDNPVLVTMKVLNEAGLLRDASTAGVDDA